MHAANNAVAVFVPINAVSERLATVGIPLATVAAIHVLTAIFV